jgi:lysophospholipase L1-like esterase
MKKVFFYGDSNTYGYDPAFYTGGRYPRRSRWTTLLAERLEGTWEVAADGMPGRMIPRAGRGTDMVLDSWRAEMPVDLFAVMLGTNDLLSMRTPDASAVAAKMENLIHGAQESLAAKILLIAPPQIRFTDPSCTQPFVQGTQTYARQCLEQSTVLAQYYKDIAARCGVFYADASSWDLALAFDGVHLSLEANAVFARELEKVIRRL